MISEVKREDRRTDGHADMASPLGLRIHSMLFVQRMHKMGYKNCLNVHYLSSLPFQ
jgi:hypothetical protein